MVTKSYSVERTIDASPQRVWELLADADGYARWNPAVVSLSGCIAGGETIKLVSTVNPGRTFSLAVSDVEPPNTMVWSDGMPLGLFRGVRTFSLRAVGAERTEFSMQERYSGPLSGLITRAIPDLSESFAQFADGLKRAAESGPS
ncbi:MAG: hypothetical protein V7607_5027 [Solirubrobacteraceae bacterium]